MPQCTNVDLMITMLKETETSNAYCVRRRLVQFACVIYRENVPRAQTAGAKFSHETAFQYFRSLAGSEQLEKKNGRIDRWRDREPGLIE